MNNFKPLHDSKMCFHLLMFQSHCLWLTDCQTWSLEDWFSHSSPEEGKFLCAHFKSDMQTGSVTSHPALNQSWSRVQLMWFLFVGTKYLTEIIHLSRVFICGTARHWTHLMCFNVTYAADLFLVFCRHFMDKINNCSIWKLTGRINDNEVNHSLIHVVLWS